MLSNAQMEAREKARISFAGYFSGNVDKPQLLKDLNAATELGVDIDLIGCPEVIKEIMEMK